jgi:hypothetical protein
MSKLLNPPAREKGRWYCGPYVMAAVTGESFTEIRRVINRAKGRPSTRGVCSVQPRELKQAFRDFGWRIFTVYHHAEEPKMRLKEFMHGLDPDDSTMYVVYITGHYVAVQGGLFIDTFSKHKVSTAFSPQSGKTVKEVYRLRKIK